MSKRIKTYVWLIEGNRELACQYREAICKAIKNCRVDIIDKIQWALSLSDQPGVILMGFTGMPPGSVNNVSTLLEKHPDAKFGAYCGSQAGWPEVLKMLSEGRIQEVSVSDPMGMANFILNEGGTACAT